jgi:N-methylhydantoinase A
VDRCRVIGVDVGGTFIDYVAVDPDGTVRTHKELSDPSDLPGTFQKGLLAVAPEGTERLVHGTTVATNALIERRGARAGLLATRGFADVLAIGRQNRPELYALAGTRRPPLVPRDLRLEADERIGSGAEIIEELDEASVIDAARAFARAGVESVAVSLLFSFLRPEHEQRAGEILRGELDAFVCLSSDVLAEYREFERTSTTVVTAYVGPLLDRYLADVIDAADGPFLVMQSNGGVIDAGDAVQRSAHLIFSGPAGGVVGAFRAARDAGFEQVLTFDMGGTSTDVAVCPGEIQSTVEAVVADVPVRVPMIDIHTVGAGGGSLAKKDVGGALRVGPESAGADPGPACYGRGTEPTVTDADLILGRLPEDRPLAGTIALDRERAEEAIRTLGIELGLDLEATALGIVRVVNAAMERAIRRVSIERGFDPRGFILVAFGGAGPMHAAELAAELGVGRVLIPRHPGVESAGGMAGADEIRDFSRTVMVRLDGKDTEVLEGLWRPLEERAAERGGLSGGGLSRSADLRYVGQSFEIEVSADDLPHLVEAFERAHQRLHGYCDPGRPVEVVNVRLRCTTPTVLPTSRVETPSAAPPPPRSRSRIRFAGGWREADLIERSSLSQGEQVEGPALLVQPDTATLVPPGWRATVDAQGNLLLEAAQ